MPTLTRTATIRTAMIAAVLSATSLAVGGTAWAHHGWGGYDSTRLVTLEGTLGSVEYQSPHVSARLPAEGKNWVLILAPPSRMTNRGLPEGSLAAGQKVRVEGYVHRSEPAEFRAERILVGNQTVELR